MTGRSSFIEAWIEGARSLLCQLLPQDISGITLLKVYRLGHQNDFNRNKTRLLNVALKFPDEKDLILHDVSKYLSLVGNTKGCQAENQPEAKVYFRIANLRVMRLRQRMMPMSGWVQHGSI